MNILCLEIYDIFPSDFMNNNHNMQLNQSLLGDASIYLYRICPPSCCQWKSAALSLLNENPVSGSWQNQRLSLAGCCGVWWEIEFEFEWWMNRTYMRAANTDRVLWTMQMDISYITQEIFCKLDVLIIS